MRAVDTLLVVVVLAVVGYLVYLLVRWYVRLDRAPAVSGPRSSPWDARYHVEADQTVWSIHREVTGADGHRREEVHEIVRIDSRSADFDEQFRDGERRAHDRALLLNSALSP